jgi:hypothetical protein
MECGSQIGPDEGAVSREERIPRCSECGRWMAPMPYGWWMCLNHPWRMSPDRNHPDYEELTKSYGR